MRKQNFERDGRSGGSVRHHESHHTNRPGDHEEQYYGRGAHDDGSQERGDRYGGPRGGRTEASRQPGGRYDEGSPSAQREGFGDFEGERPNRGEASGGYYGRDRNDRWNAQDDARRYATDYRDPFSRYGSERDAGQDFDSRASDRRSDMAGSQRYTTGYPYGSQSFGDSASPYGAGTGDDRSRENHRGRGPKNYTRSDERIREDLCEQLSEDASIDASEIDVTVEGGVVTLTGTIHSRSLKHRAEDLADRCSGVTDVQNRLTVKASGTAHPDSLVGQGSQEGVDNGAATGARRPDPPNKKR